MPPQASDNEGAAARVRPRRATIVDVAAAAGVSRQTVSRVVSGGDLVAPQTHARVTKAIEQLGYRPNYLARTLVQRKSRILGVAARDLNSPLTPPFIERLQALCQPLGYHVIVSNFDLEEEGGAGTLHTFVSLSVDGIALFPSVMKSTVIEQFVGSYDGRLVVVGRTDAFVGAHSLSLDEDAAAQLIVDHLRNRGRSKVALLTDEWYPAIEHSRVAGLQAALRESGCPAVQIIGGHEPTIAGGIAAMIELISTATARGVDAVVTYNDTMAFGVLHACRTMGLSIPGDIALVGYDGTPFGEVCDPPLTTVPQEAGRYADIVFNLLVNAEHDSTPVDGVTLVPPSLLVRGST